MTTNKKDHKETDNNLINGEWNSQSRVNNENKKNLQKLNRVFL